MRESTLTDHTHVAADSASPPDDWTEGSLVGVARQDSPIGYGIVQPGPYVRGGVPVIAIRDLPNPSMRSVHRTAKEIEAAYRRSRVRGGDILISVKGTTGRVGIVPEGFDGNISRDVARVRLTDEHHPGFWQQMLQSTGAQQLLRLAAVGSTRQELSIGTLKQVRFAYPSKTAQQRISDVLSDFDQRIAVVERSIIKTQAIKQGMMQQLLSGTHRLPGFTQPWRDTRLGDQATMGSGGTPPSATPQYYGGGIPWVSISDMTSASKHVHVTERTLSDDGLSHSAAKLYDAGVVLYAMYASLGECALPVGRMSSSQAILGILSGKDLDREYLYYYLCYRKREVIEMGQQGTQSNLNAGMVRNFALSLPEPDEQRAIAGTLADLDGELDVLDARLRKAKAIKLGMMQQLLTGQTRLQVAEAVA